MSERKLKWGILGAARVNERLLPAIIEASNSQLVAIASRRAGAAQATLEKYAPNYKENVVCYDDMDALINDKNIDAIYCPMANEEHAEWALKAINAGKHVLIEKPMATSLKDIEAIEAAAKVKQCKSDGRFYVSLSSATCAGSGNCKKWRDWRYFKRAF